MEYDPHLALSGAEFEKGFRFRMKTVDEFGKTNLLVSDALWFRSAVGLVRTLGWQHP